MKQTLVIPDSDFRERRQSVGEEIANSVSHGLGFIASLVAVPYLLAHAHRYDGTENVVGAAIFGGTMILLYLISTLYHALPHGQAKHVFRIIEHAMIFLLIAGTYTPFTLGVLRGTWGWSLFGGIWALAVGGIVLKVFGGVRFPILSTVLYLIMGWLVMIAIVPLWHRMPHAGFIWLTLGGLSYTLGVLFYALDSRMRYNHFVWHLFVLVGTTFHYFAVLWYAA
jgi:hemolysin III